jgi:RNA recognition motif-containing protein
MSSSSLWMGDIESWMDEQYIKNIFIGIAKVVSVKIMKKNGITAGYCFVEFESKEVADFVLNNYNNKAVSGSSKILKLSEAIFGGLKSQQPVEYQIYVCEMDQKVTEDDLRNFFLKFYKSITSVKIVVDPNTKQSKGYGFVRFTDQEEANNALVEMNGKVIKTHPIKVNLATFKKEGEQTIQNNYVPTQQNVFPQMPIYQPIQQYPQSFQNIPGYYAYPPQNTYYPQPTYIPTYPQYPIYPMYQQQPIYYPTTDQYSQDQGIYDQQQYIDYNQYYSYPQMQQSYQIDDQNYSQQNTKQTHYQKGVKTNQNHKFIQESSENSFQKYMSMVNKDINKSEDKLKK